MRKRRRTFKSKNISHQRSLKGILGNNKQTTYPQIFYPPPLKSFLKQQQLTYPRYAKPQPQRRVWDLSVPSNLLIPIGGIGLFILGFVAVIKGLSWSAIAVGLISWFGVILGLQQFIRWWGRKRRQHLQDYQYFQ
ncbi:MAG: hypothetical protein MK111_25185, partial [Crocosphaera sp.]|nr:hypothetical protein [Crocosphaera sp.]